MTPEEEQAILLNLRLQTKEWVKEVIQEVLNNEALYLSMGTVNDLSYKLDGNYNFKNAVKRVMIEQMSKQ
jgi:hypothetical protein